MRILGIDYGSRRIGVALGDTETGVATPWRVIAHEATEDAVEQLSLLAKQEGAERFVIGIPRPLADQSRLTEQAKEIREFAKHLAQVGLPIEEENETLSSALAERQVREMGEKGKRDDLAAAAILQSYLDRLKSP